MALLRGGMIHAARTLLAGTAVAVPDISSAEQLTHRRGFGLRPQANKDISAESRLDTYSESKPCPALPFQALSFSSRAREVALGTCHSVDKGQ